MKFLGQDFQTLEPEQDRQTDVTECITTLHICHTARVNVEAITNTA